MFDRDVVISGTGVVSPLGDEPARLMRAIKAGARAFEPVSGFDFDAAGLRARDAAQIRDFDPQAYLGGGNLRPLDRTARLTVSAATLALAASGWDDERLRADHDLGLVLGTMFGSVHTISAFDLRAQTAGPKYAKPLEFANSVINAAAGQTAIWHQLRGINSTVAGGPTAGLKAIATAADAIGRGRAEVILAGGVEELAFEAWVGFAACGWIAGSRATTGPSGESSDGRSSDGRCSDGECSDGGGSDGGGQPRDVTPVHVPFAAGRNGFSLGEGAALLVLESEETAASRDAMPLGRLRGHGSAFDPSRGHDAESSADALTRAIRAALDSAEMKPAEVDLVSASASGSVAGDRAEAEAIARVLGPEIPVIAVKAALGESLGAAGALQTLAFLSVAADGEVPGITGLETVAEDVPLTSLSRARRRLDVRHGLITALGLDGNAEALVVSGGVS